MLQMHSRKDGARGGEVLAVTNTMAERTYHGLISGVLHSKLGLRNTKRGAQRESHKILC